MRGEYSLADIRAVTEGNGGFGGENGAWWLIILIVLFGWGRNGGYGGSGANDNYVLTSDFAQLSKQISDTYNMTDRKFEGVTNGLCQGFYQEAQLVNGINTNILQGTNTLNASIKDFCCTTQRSIDNVNFNNAQNTSLITNAITLNGRDIIDNMNANYRALHDEIVANRIEDKNAQIAAQQNEINALRLAASQEKQNAYLVDKLNPNKCPIPAYLTCNPNAPLNYSISYNNGGCGCGY